MSGVWLTEADIAEVLDLGGAIDAVRTGFREEAAGRASAMTKTHAGFAAGSLHALGAVMSGAGGGATDGPGVAGTKTWAHTAGGAAPLLVLFSTEDGSPLAVIEAFALGQLRTAAVSAVATDALSAPGAATLAMCGTGKQALAQVAAVAAVRPIQRVRVWSPDAGHRQEFVERVQVELSIDAAACESAAAALEGADVVTLATRSRAPFIRSADVAAGAHVNAVGAITADRAEFDVELLDRAAVVTADNIDAARHLSSELMAWCGDDAAGWQRVVPLARLVATSGASAGGVSVLKAMGSGVADVAIGEACRRLAVGAGLGRPLPGRVHIAPNLDARGTMHGQERRLP